MMNEATPHLTRGAGLERLEGFLPKAGFLYAKNRNYDILHHPHVSGLSPYLRYRLITEAEVLDRVHAKHQGDADKFVAEVLWRTYWKGFLELRPQLWTGYKADLGAALNRVAVESGLRQHWEDACGGKTEIAAFDHWARELVSTGYLHNHARMWFASIWIFTLRLPWVLGADFFLRHLTDGDPASNTLSWRWVAGLHTPGKTYAATRDNIEKYTEGRFSPPGLAANCPPVQGQANPPPRTLRFSTEWDYAAPSVLLVHEDDLSPEWLLASGLQPKTVVLTHATQSRSPLQPNPDLSKRLDIALDDCAARFRALLPDSTPIVVSSTPETDIVNLCNQTGAAQVVTPYAPCGWMADRLTLIERALSPSEVTLSRVARDYDQSLWPAATHGFFRFRETVGANFGQAGA